MTPRILYITPFAVATLGILAVAFVVLHHRRIRGGTVLFFLCLSAALWSTTEGLLFVGFAQETNILITKVQYIGIAALPPLALQMVFVIFGLSSTNTRTLHYAQLAIAALIIVEVWLNEFHNLHFSDYYVIHGEHFRMLGYVHGPLWHVIIGYHYLVLLAITVIILKRLRSSERVYRKQAQALLISVLVVWAANGVYVAGISPVPNMDTGPIAFSVVAAAFAWGFLKYNLFDIAPIAKEKIFANLRDPVVIFDENGRIVEINHAASEIIEKKIGGVIGLKLTDVFPGIPSLAASARNGRTSEVALRTKEGEMHFDAKINTLEDRKGRAMGSLLVMHDITKRKMLENKLTQIAHTDVLTGASNRRHLFELGERDFYRAKRYGYELCAVMIDIDRFKRLNDMYGHEIGDEALKRLVETCKNEIRGGDIFGRIGGEEFVTIYANQSLEQAQQAAERLRQQIAAIQIPVPKGTIGITASLGVAALKKEDLSFDDLLRRADGALYAAKNAGRNCVRIGT